MNFGKISLQGFEKVFDFLAPLLKVPEERHRLNAEAQERLSEAYKKRSETVTNALKELAETRSLELQNLEQAISLYEKLGYSEKQIRKLIGPKLQQLLMIYDDLITIRQLVENDVILDAKIRRLKYVPPSETK